ncbi:DUF4255 domain-containing protein [Gynuella sp.]|uniref:DUF4255 domain-containing protein n=1 Tax=Gynuella sp. TaxID=2969146 RepID=UPI003D126586
MLDRVLDFFDGELNAFFQAKTGAIGTTVAAGAIVNDSGKYVVPQDSIAATIINIEEDTSLKEQNRENRFQQGQNIQVEPRLKLNLFILFSANYSHYDQALKHLSLVLTYFQSHRSFSRERYPALNENIERLAVELQTLNYDQLNQIWAYLGGKYLPSIVYRVRLVSIQDQTPATILPPVTIVNTSTGGQ